MITTGEVIIAKENNINKNNIMPIEVVLEARERALYRREI